MTLKTKPLLQALREFFDKEKDFFIAAKFAMKKDNPDDDGTACLIQTWVQFVDDAIQKTSTPFPVLLKVWICEIEEIEEVLGESFLHVAKDELPYLKEILRNYETNKLVRISEDESAEPWPFVGFVVDARQVHEALKDKEVVLKNATIIMGRHCSSCGLLLDYKMFGTVQQFQIDSDHLHLDEGPFSVGAAGDGPAAWNY